MATRTRTPPKQRIPARDQDEANFQAWLSDFDARHAELAARLAKSAPTRSGLCASDASVIGSPRLFARSSSGIAG